jgi:hypothetical protein
MPFPVPAASQIAPGPSGAQSASPEYHTFYKLSDAVENFVIGLYVAYARGRPQLIRREERFIAVTT